MEVGASFTGVTVIALLPETERRPSLTFVAIAKLALEFEAGVNVTPASSVLMCAVGPDALQVPVPALYVEVTGPEVAVRRLPAHGFDSVRVAVRVGLSISDATMSTRSSATSSV